MHDIQAAEMIRRHNLVTARRIGTLDLKFINAVTITIAVPHLTAGTAKDEVDTVTSPLVMTGFPSAKFGDFQILFFPGHTSPALSIKATGPASKADSANLNIATS